ncbi:NADP-dependent oxidoreductase [Microbacterium sp.]|uniref:NADP-dependent oxidoreductase n=1 Tax=Microbacterium sp. TaxID=51671 RepID=UPI0035B3B5A7
MRVPQKTIRFEYDAPGDPSVITRREMPLARPAPDEVTVEMVCAGVSHVDAIIRRGDEPEWADEPFPRGSGSDFAGIVVATGDSVTGIRVGAEVVGLVRAGPHATFLNVPAAQVVPKPRNLTWEAAGGLFLAGATALTVLDELRIGSDDVIVVTAAAGGVGSLEVQIAKHWGAKVIGTCGARNFDYLRQLGITPVQYGEGIVELISRAAGRPVTAFVDNFGQDGEDLAEALGVSGSRYRSSADRRRVELRLLSAAPEDVAAGTTQLRRLTRLAQDRAFRLLVSGVYATDDIVEAYEDLDRLHARGKIVVATHPVAAYRTLRARDVVEALP